MKKSIAKKLILMLLILAALASFSGCTFLTSSTELAEDALTEEAKSAFSALSGEHGIMLYADTAQNTMLKMRLYAVLYGTSGQEIRIKKSGTSLYLQVAGEPKSGYSVWRIEYSPMAVQRVEFQKDGETLTMDGYEEITFTVEKELEEAENE